MKMTPKRKFQRQKARRFYRQGMVKSFGEFLPHTIPRSDIRRIIRENWDGSTDWTEKAVQSYNY